MPRKAKSLWPRVASWPALVEAYQRARKGKREKPQAVDFHRHWEERLLYIQEELRRGTWTPKPLTAFPVFEPKYRVIEAPAFPDRIVHHAVVAAVEPYFERRFSEQSFACRKGKGIHRAARYVQRCLRQGQQLWGKPWVLQIDISKYFPSIDHDILVERFARTIGCPPTRRLYEACVRGMERDKGLPIGALTSQLGGNVYLDTLDHFAQDDLGIKGYARYMDDTVMIGSCKAQMQRVLKEVRQMLGDELRLELSKAHIYPAKQGVDFAGYRTWPTHILPRRRNVVAARRRVKRAAKDVQQGLATLGDLEAQLASLSGYLQHCDAHVLHQQIIDEMEAACAPA